MKLESQVCSLELAKKLKALGVKQKSYAYWIEGKLLAIGEENPATYWSVPYISAFTVAELGEMLPRTIRKGQTYYAPTIWFGEQTTYINYDNREGSKLNPIAGSEADARAKMLCYLLENKLVTLPFGA